MKKYTNNQVQLDVIQVAEAAGYTKRPCPGRGFWLYNPSRGSGISSIKVKYNGTWANPTVSLTGKGSIDFAEMLKRVK